MNAQRAMHSARRPIHTGHCTTHITQGTMHNAQLHNALLYATHNPQRTERTPHAQRTPYSYVHTSMTRCGKRVRRTYPPTHPPIQSPHLLHVDHTSSVFGDVVQRELELLLAVTSKRSQHLRREALVVHADGHAFQVRMAFLEPD